MYSFENNVLPTLRCYNARPLQDIRKIALGCVVLLAREWSLGHQLHGVHLRPVHLGVGESHPRAFDTDRPLDDFKSRAGTQKPLQEPEVAAWNRLGRP